LFCFALFNLLYLLHYVTKVARIQNKNVLLLYKSFD